MWPPVSPQCTEKWDLLYCIINPILLGIFLWGPHLPLNQCPCLYWPGKKGGPLFPPAHRFLLSVDKSTGCTPTWCPFRSFIVPILPMPRILSVQISGDGGFEVHQIGPVSHYQAGRRGQLICTCSTALCSAPVCFCHQRQPARHIHGSGLAEVTGTADGPGLMLCMQRPPAMDLIKAFEKRQALITCGHIRAYQLSLLNCLQIISGLFKSND